MNLGVSTASFYPLETELALEYIGKEKIPVSEVFFNARSELKPAFIDILKSIKNRYKISIPAIHPTMSLAESFMIFSAYDRRFYEALDEYKRYAEIAAELGSNFIILHGGKPNGILSDEEYCERYMRLNEVTKPFKVTVLQENVHNYRSGEIEFLRAMRNILGNDAKFCFDIKQSVRCGYLPIEMIDEFYDNIMHFHISDHSLSTDCTLPGKGKFNFNEFFNYLNKRNFNGNCIIEVYNNSYSEYAEIAKSYCLLKGIL